MTYHFYCFLFFETVLDREHSGTVPKNSSQLLFLRNHLSSPSEPAILNKSTTCLGLKSSPRLKYKLSKVDYSPTPWGLVIHRSTCKPPRMPHVSPGWGGGVGVSIARCITDQIWELYSYKESRITLGNFSSKLGQVWITFEVFIVLSWNVAQWQVLILQNICLF